MAKTKQKAKRKAKRFAAVGGAGKVIRREFKGLPMVDAKADFSLVLRTADIHAAKGHAKDPENCALAKACARQLHSSKVVFFRSVAYVDMPDEKGVRSVIRFILPDNTSAIIRAFDKGESVKGEVMVALKAPSDSCTLDAALKRYRNSQKLRAARRAAMLRGEITGGDTGVGIFKKPRVADIDVRNGSGMVHNTVKA